jgi:hypothetical protein
MARDKHIIISGEQRPDIDPRDVARVLVRLARHWQTKRTPKPERPKAVRS